MTLHIEQSGIRRVRPQQKQRSFAEAASYLQNLLESVQHQPDLWLNDKKSLVLRLQIEIQPVDFCAWLLATRTTTALYWANKEKTDIAAGVGVADLVTTGYAGDVAVLKTVFRRIRNILSGADEHARYYGGFRFAPPQNFDPTWREFGSGSLILPRFELRSIIREGRTITTLACHLLGDTSELLRNSAGAALTELQDMPHIIPVATGTLPVVQFNEAIPDRQEWNTMMRAALDDIREGVLQKIVLARKTVYRIQEPVSPLFVFQHLIQQNPESYHFLLRTGKQVFMGCPPERLYARKADILETEAIAGTRKRSSIQEEDERLTEELLHSEKEVREHNIVRDSILTMLQHVCENVESGETPVALKLQRLQHLKTPICGRLYRFVYDHDILAALHPTPALGGFPKHIAERRIAELEPFDRGCYGAPVGWISPNAAEFAVAIRSALLDAAHVHVFAGAGIVQGSEAKSEWMEIEHKMNNFLSVFSQ